MRWPLAASLLAVGCRQVFGIGDPELAGDATIADGVGDAARDTTSSNCFGSPIQICMAQPPQAPFMFGSNISFDTDSGLCQEFTSPQGMTGCLIAGSSVALTGGTIHVSGTRPLIVLSTSSMTLATGAVLDVASHTGVSRGPGANPASCSSGTPPTTGGGTAGGGAGGSFGGRGGGGGLGAQGGNGGNSGALSQGTALGGGCAGQTGGSGNGGVGGDGGGAILLVAVTTIQLDGTLDASGGGAGGGVASTGGGGGGGSGGMVLLEAETVTGTGILFASGGGGGEGSGTGASGNPGSEAIGPTVSAPGGSGGNSNSGDGGDGTSGAVLAGKSGGNAQSTANGGGGGGGAGYVLVHATTQSIASTNVAPPVILLP